MKIHAVAALAVLVATAVPATAVAAEPALAVKAVLVPHSIRFGDRVQARVVVRLDPARAMASSLRALPEFVPFEPEGPAVREGTSFRYRLTCLGETCLPVRGERVFRLPAGRVEVRLKGGGRIQARFTWPSLTVRTRVGPRERAVAKPPWRTSSALPGVGYALGPGPLSAGLVAAACLLVLTAAAVLFAGRARGRVVTQDRGLSALACAVQLTRDSLARRDARDRRKALDLLARELGRAGQPRLRGSARGLAWSRDAPSREPVEELVEDVERMGSAT